MVLLPIADWINAQCSAIGATIAYFISASLGSVVVIRNFGERIAKWNEQVRQTCHYKPTGLSLLPSANIGLKYSLCITESTCSITWLFLELHLCLLIGWPILELLIWMFLSMPFSGEHFLV